MKHFVKYDSFDIKQLNLSLGADRNNKPTIAMTYGAASGDVALVSAPCITMWPRCTGDGNFGTMWGPTDPAKAKYTLDLTDNAINNTANEFFVAFAEVIDAIDDALLDFVTANQLRILGRKNLGREEIKMLQIRSVRTKYDKISGALNGYAVNLSSDKYAWNGMGAKTQRDIVVCDHNGKTVKNGVVGPGDVVAATMYANRVYTGMAGDKFGIHWGFQDVSVICQQRNLEQKTEVNAFVGMDCAYAKPYVQVSEDFPSTFDATDQFGTEANPIRLE
jgi:hypothetical protein